MNSSSRLQNGGFVNAAPISVLTTMKSSTASISSNTKPKKGWKRKWGKNDMAQPTSALARNNYAPEFKKVYIPGMSCPIIVDGFNYASKTLSDCYFLTHFHSDHYTGLTRTFDCGRIYCSPSTAALVKLRICKFSSIIPLQLESEYNIDVGGMTVKVTFMDANHCPGAVTILFTFQNGKRVLHTGDFRWTNETLNLPTSVSYRSIAANNNNTKNLVVYLDTTYCGESHAFPPQEDIIKEIMANASGHLDDTNTSLIGGGAILFVVGAYQIGKERVYMSLAKSLGLKVHVDTNRKKNTECFDWPQVDHNFVTTDPVIPMPTSIHPDGPKAAIIALYMNQLNFGTLSKIQSGFKHNFSKVVAYQPTGWSHTGRRGGGKAKTNSYDNGSVENSARRSLLVPRQKGNITIYGAAYSEHSSFTELVQFVRVFKPQRIVPTVNTGSQEKMKQQIDLLKKHSIMNGVYK